MNAKIRSWLTATLVALATMAIVVVANWPNVLDAKAPAPARKLARVIKLPTLTVHGCRLSILPPDKAAKPDQEYVISIKAQNTTDKSVHFDMKVAVRSTALSSMVSRAPVMPKESWQQVCPVSLVAGETMIIEVATGKKASALGAMLSPHVTVDGKHLHGSPFGGLRMFRHVPRGRTPNGNIPITAIKQVAAMQAARTQAGG